MKKPDEFNEWMKRQLEDNPQEPPEESWQHIEEGLELETAWQGIHQDLELDSLWQGIDHRLNLAKRVMWWNRAGALLTASVALVAIALPLLLQQPDNQMEAIDETAVSDLDQTVGVVKPAASEAAKEKEAFSIQTEAMSPAQPQPILGNAAATATAGDVLVKENKSSAVSEEQDKWKDTAAKGGLPTDLTGLYTESPAIAKGALSFPLISVSPASASASEGAKTDDINAITGAAIQAKKAVLASPAAADSAEGASKETVAEVSPNAEAAAGIVEKKVPSFGYWRVGAGASARMSWLLNQKTYMAMDKSSLTTALPAFRKSVSLMTERGISPQLSIHTDLVLHSEVGQRYKEYQSGVYGTTDTKLRYSQLNVMLAYNKGATALLNRSYNHWLLGGYAAWLHQASQSGPLGVQNITSEYTQATAGLMVGYEYVYPLGKQFWLGYGLRGYIDLLNIYAGTGDIPAHFRRTRSTSLDFTINIKYEIRKK